MPLGNYANKKPFESSISSAKRYFGWLLARREYAEAELLQKAKQKGYTPEHIAEAMAFMQKHGLQDDARYAGMKSRSAAHRYGDRKIEHLLKSKKVAPDIIVAQVQELAPEEDRAWNAIDRHAGEPLTAELNAKLWRRLASKGFGSAAIKAAIRRLRDESA